MPSIDADVIPPAYPAPSPQGYIPLILLSSSLLRSIRIGELVRASIPASTAS